MSGASASAIKALAGGSLTGLRRASSISGDNEMPIVTCVCGCGETKSLPPSLVRSVNFLDWAHRAAHARQKWHLDTELKRRYAQDLDTRGLSVEAMGREAGIRPGAVRSWLRRSGALLYPKHLAEIATWLGITYSDALAMQGGAYYRADRSNSTTWWKDPRKKAQARRRQSVAARGRQLAWSRESIEKRATAARGRPHPHRITTLTRVIRSLNALRRNLPLATDQEIETRAVANLVQQRGLSTRSARSLVRQAITGKKGGRPRGGNLNIDPIDVIARLAANETQKHVAAHYGTTAEAIEQIARRELDR